MGVSDPVSAVSSSSASINRNSETLLSHGNAVGREDVLEILEAGLKASDPYKNVMEFMWLDFLGSKRGED